MTTTPPVLDITQNDNVAARAGDKLRKRVAFARAMVLQPRILLYDEPTAGLDPVTTETVVDVILRGQDRLHATALMITNNLAVAFSLADRIAFLHEGRVVLEGPPEAFRLTLPPDIPVQRLD